MIQGRWTALRISSSPPVREQRVRQTKWRGVFDNSGGAAADTGADLRSDAGVEECKDGVCAKINQDGDLS